MYDGGCLHSRHPCGGAGISLGLGDKKAYKTSVNTDIGQNPGCHALENVNAEIGQHTPENPMGGPLMADREGRIDLHQHDGEEEDGDQGPDEALDQAVPEEEPVQGHGNIPQGSADLAKRHGSQGHDRHGRDACQTAEQGPDQGTKRLGEDQGVGPDREGKHEVALIREQVLVEALHAEHDGHDHGRDDEDRKGRDHQSADPVGIGFFRQEPDPEADQEGQADGGCVQGQYDPPECFHFISNQFCQHRDTSKNPTTSFYINVYVCTYRYTLFYSCMWHS